MDAISAKMTEHHPPPLKAGESGRALGIVTLALLVLGCVVLHELSGAWDTPMLEVQSPSPVVAHDAPVDNSPHPLRPVPPSPFGLPSEIAPVDGLGHPLPTSGDFLPLITMPAMPATNGPANSLDAWQDASPLRLGRQPEEFNQY
jgi:hypothetical protein